MAAHRYWRIYCRSSAPGNSFATFAEIEFRESLGGANVATAGSGVVSASSVFGTPTYQASNAIDGNAATMWESASTIGATHWWQIYLNTARDIQEIAIKANASWPDETPRVFDVLWSDDGINWGKRFAISDSATAWTAGQLRVFNASSTGASGPYTYPASPVAYWRLYFTLGYLNGWVSLATVAMKESTGGANVSVAANGTASASHTSGSSVASNAVDGNSTSYWENTGLLPAWWAFTFGAARSITEISLTSATAWPNEVPVGTEIQWSTDGVTWATAWMVQDSALPWANPETRTYTYSAEAAPTITGTGSATLESLTSSASGSTVTGTGSATGAALTSSASGNAVAPPVTGTAASTLEALTGSSLGSQLIEGIGGASLAALISSASGSTVAGTGAASLPALVSHGTGMMGQIRHQIGLHATWAAQL